MNFVGKEYRLSVILPWIGRVVEGYKSRLVVSVFLGWIGVVLNFAFVWLAKLIVDTATAGHNHRGLLTACMVLMAVVVLQIATTAVNRRVRTLTAFKMNRRMQEALLQRAVRACIDIMSRYHTGDLVRRFMTDGEAVVAFVSGTLPALAYVVLQIAGAYVFLAILEWHTAVALALIMAMGSIAGRWHFQKIRRFSARIKEGGSMLQGALQEGLQNLPLLKSLAGRGLFQEYYARLFSVQEGNIRRRIGYTVVSSSVLSLGFAACYLLVFVWGAFSIEAGTITYGTLIAFVQLVGQIQGPSRTLINSISDFAEFYTSCERLNEIDAIPADEEEKGVISLPLEAPDIVCEDVSFGYEDGHNVVINAFSHRFKAGEFCVIAGATGAGKTTLMRLLLAYAKPQTGSLALAYGDDKKIPISSATRGAFAYVPQGDTLFGMTLRENLQLANPAATDAQMLQALEWACADFAVQSLEGLDTICGEAGRGMSQGQAQRVCIARALLSKAPVLLMDEATSALDHETEEQVIANIRRYAVGKTILFISHRDTAAKFAGDVVRF